MNYKIAFIILHYQTLDETIKCIESIKNRIDTENYEIIIVDNCSPNGSGKILYDKYNEIERYHVLLNEKNLGFSAGNNIGFRHAKKIKCDFIAMINNDTCLITDNFRFSFQKAGAERSRCEAFRCCSGTHYIPYCGHLDRS